MYLQNKIPAPLAKNDTIYEIDSKFPSKTAPCKNSFMCVKVCEDLFCAMFLQIYILVHNLRFVLAYT